MLLLQLYCKLEIVVDLVLDISLYCISTMIANSQVYKCKSNNFIPNNVIYCTIETTLANCNSYDRLLMEFSHYLGC